MYLTMNIRKNSTNYPCIDNLDNIQLRYGIIRV